MNLNDEREARRTAYTKEVMKQFIVQWQCTCGAWIPVGFSSHSHVETKGPTFAELHEMRRAHESGLTGVVPDALDAKAEITRVFRTKEMPVK